jgi:hypothetical protein
MGLLPALQDAINEALEQESRQQRLGGGRALPMPRCPFAVVIPRSPDHVLSELRLKIVLSREVYAFEDSRVKFIERKVANRVLKRPLVAPCVPEIEEPPAELVNGKGKRGCRHQNAFVEPLVKQPRNNAVARNAFQLMRFIDDQQVKAGAATETRTGLKSVQFVLNGVIGSIHPASPLAIETPENAPGALERDLAGMHAAQVAFHQVLYQCPAFVWTKP